MATLNDGRATYTHTSGSESAPDTSIVHASELDKISWEVTDDFGNDHKPMIITYGTTLSKIEDKPQYKWKIGKAEWNSFREEVEKRIPSPEEYEQMDLEEMESVLRNAINDSASQHVGRKKVSSKSNMWMTPEIKESIKKRNELRANAAQH